MKSRRFVSWLGVLGLATFVAGAPGCQPFDTSRVLPVRGTVGTEMFGVLCDRLGAQNLREDLSGTSFHAVCHAPSAGGSFADTVDESKLPPLDASATDTNGNVVPMTKQKSDRATSIRKVEAMARRRSDLIRAFDATFPKDQIVVHDLTNSDGTKTCTPLKKAGVLTDALSDMLGRLGPLYNDGTLPQSTESLATVVAAFQKDDAAQAAWSRMSAREGYRPIDTTLGAIRPVLAYPGMRDFANASLRLLSADAQPYAADSPHDSAGNRLPIAGPANGSLNKLLEAAHAELLNATADPALAPLTTTKDAANRVILSRPRDNLEVLQRILYTEDDAFVNGGSAFIVRRDNRGYAAIRDGKVPAPLVDADGDGLPDVDAVGRYVTTDGSVVPAPFNFPHSATTQRDPFDRAMVGDGLLFNYFDTSRTYAARTMVDLKPLVDSNVADKHETLMDAAGAVPIILGPRATTTKSYADGSKVQYNGIRTADSPALDAIYALGAILGDKTGDQALALTSSLFTDAQPQMARATGAISAAFDIAQLHPEAKIPRTSTYWDENLDILAKTAQEPGLLEDLMLALTDPATQGLGGIFSKYAHFRDEISYDRNNLNGPAFNVTTNDTTELHTPVDHTQPITGKNRSALYRFLGLIVDTDHVTTCNRPSAKVHAKLGPISVTMPITGSYEECEVFKIEELSQFYVDSIAHGWEFDADTKPNKRGALYLRNDTLRNGIALGIGAATKGLIEASSGITGMVPTGNNHDLTTSPNFLNRLVFFDVKNDSPNNGDTNYRTNHFLADLNGVIGTSVCPERTITDPLPSAVDASSDGVVHGLRNCTDDTLVQSRDANTIFTWEDLGFYDAVRPIVAAFAKHGREDLFVALSSAVFRHYGGADATDSECRIVGNLPCARSNIASYEPLLVDALAGDALPAVSELVRSLSTLAVKCAPGDLGCDATTGTVSGLQISANAARAALDPSYAKSINLTDRAGNVTTKRNDGTVVPQVTPAYMLANALSSIDLAFDAYETQNPNDTARRSNWRRARSQIVDQFLGVTGIQGNSAFSNPGIPKVTPIVVELMRSQLLAHCPTSFSPPFDSCTWARTELLKKAQDSITGPLVVNGVDILDAIQKDPDGRHETEKLLEYLVDEASTNDALAGLLASSNDIIQLLRDDTNLLPFYKVAATAVNATTYDANGKILQKSLVDAQTALLARVYGKYNDKSGKEICKNEVDPDQVITQVLANLVTPIKDGAFNGDTPLDVVIDVIAEINRQDLTQTYSGTLKKDDYGFVSANVVDFLMNKEHGLEQFYEVIRQGTKYL